MTPTFDVTLSVLDLSREDRLTIALHYIEDISYECAIGAFSPPLEDLVTSLSTEAVVALRNALNALAINMENNRS